MAELQFTSGEFAIFNAINFVNPTQGNRESNLTFIIDDSIDEMTFLINPEESESQFQNHNMILTSPGGLQINPAHAQNDPNMEFHENIAEGFAFYYVNNPEPGEWTVSYNEQVNLNLTAPINSNFAVQINMPDSVFVVNDIVEVSVSLPDNVNVSNPQFSASLRHQAIDSSNWTNAGSVNITDSGNGTLYIGDFVAVQPGTYLVLLDFTGVVNGETVHRSTSGSALVSGSGPGEEAWVEQAKLLASDGAAGDGFGYTVDIYGEWAIVGADWDDDNGNYSGSAYIFYWNGGNWVQYQKITASDGVAGDRFGYSVSIFENLALVGSWWDGDGGNYSGSAYIFRFDGSSWFEEQKITAEDGESNDRFGVSVDIINDGAIIGSYYDDDHGDNSGSAYVFKWTGESWIQQQKLTASDGMLNDEFGISVAISTDRIIIGSHYDNHGNSDSGSAYVFNWNGNDWIQQQKLVANDGTSSDYFGHSVSIYGDNVIVGAYGDGDNYSRSGSAYIFNWTGNNWVQKQKLTADDSAASDYFGYAVAISEDIAIIGAHQNDDNGTNSGSVYIFHLSNSIWRQEKLNATDGETEDNFGVSVAISNNRFIIGANGDNNHGPWSGAAYIFTSVSITSGDINQDGHINSSDADILTSAVLGLSNLTGAQFLAADINGDGVLDILDIVEIVNLMVTQ